MSTNKPNCILHIGMHKTGSSSIQESLGIQLSNPKFEYLKLCRGNNHSRVIYTLFSETPDTYPMNIREKLTKEQILDINKANIKNLALLLEKTQSNSVIISAEDLLFLTENELYKLKNFLDPYCRSIQVIGYVRLPIAYMQSVLQEIIKDGQMRFELDLLYPHPSYREKFEKFDRVFGENNVKLLKYEISNFLNRDVVLDFCSQIDISIRPESVKRVNDSLSLEATSLLYAYRIFGYGFGTVYENNALIEKISAIGNKKISLSSKAVQPILKKNIADIHWMETRLGCSLNEELNDSKDSISSVDDLIVLSTEYAEELKQLLFEQIQQQPATPQKIADWMFLLRQQLSNSKPSPSQTQINTVFSTKQIENLKAKNLQLKDILKEFVLSLGRAGYKEAATNVISKLEPLMQEGDKIAHSKEMDISFSIDSYQDDYIKGWIVDKSNPLRKLTIELRCIQAILGKGIADQFRLDLANGEIGDGHCAFKIKVDSGVKDFGEQIIIRVIDYNKNFYVKTSSIHGIN